jgi:hypothetical protein
MEISKLLEETKTKQKLLVDRIKAIESEKQQLLQEALRLDGEVRVLTKLASSEENKTKEDS